MIERKKLDALLLGALELEPPEREAFLDRECQTPEIREALERLLVASARESAAVPLGAALWEQLGNRPRGGLEPDERLGAYRIVSELGQGGMAVVYLAERADGQFEQKVALKILERIGSGPPGAHEIARFERERRILASLDHPGIAHILDGGIAPDGRPWFAMELVEGDHIDVYCDQHQLDLASRLRLFAEVGKAVAAAHQQLVVHRDLKPSNILVAKDGRPKLLDFGIAKLIEDELSPSRPEITRAAVPMTPRYASPEQAAGRPVTTASDVYQLGLLLYELLVGEWAFEFAGSTPSEIATAPSRLEPTRPSVAAAEVAAGEGEERARRRGCGSVRQLKKLLIGDLDTIVLTALRPEAERRYESAAKLVEDVERYLAGRPILARGDSFTYRARKFVGRNRWAVAASVAGLATALSLSVVYTLRVRDERDRAEREAEKARQVAEFLGDLFRASDPYTTQQVKPKSALDLLDEGARQLREGSGLVDQPETRAALLDLVGEVYGRMGRSGPALEHNQEALTLQENLLGRDHPDTLETWLHRVQLERLAGNNREALELARELRPRLEEVLGPKHRLVSRALQELAMSTVRLGSPSEAKVFIDEAIEIEQEQAPIELGRLASLLSTSASIASRLGEQESAIEQVRRAVELRRPLDSGHPGLATVLTQLAGLLRNQGKLEEARTTLLEAEGILLKRAGPEHPQTLRTSFDIASLEIYLGQPAEALRRLDADLPVALRTMGETNQWLAIGRMDRATALVDLGRLEEAVPEARRAHRGMIAALGEGAQLSLDFARKLGNILKDAGHLVEARVVLSDLANRAAAQTPLPQLILLLAQKELAEVCFKLGELGAAQRSIDQSLELQGQLWPDGHIDTVRSLAWRAEILNAQKRHEEARAELRRALDMAARVEGMSPLLAERLEQLKRAMLEVP